MHSDYSQSFLKLPLVFCRKRTVLILIVCFTDVSTVCWCPSMWDSILFAWNIYLIKISRGTGVCVWGGYNLKGMYSVLGINIFRYSRTMAKCFIHPRNIFILLPALLQLILYATNTTSLFVLLPQKHRPNLLFGEICSLAYLSCRTDPTDLFLGHTYPVEHTLSVLFFMSCLWLLYRLFIRGSIPVRFQ